MPENKLAAYLFHTWSEMARQYNVYVVVKLSCLFKDKVYFPS